MFFRVLLLQASCSKGKGGGARNSTYFFHFSCENSRILG
jgi:hypothetical protein